MTSTDTNSQQRQQKWAWIWIAYTGFLFIEPIFNPSREMWLGTIGVFTLFLGIFAAYVRGTDDHSPLRLWMIGATFLLGLITFPWNPGASCLFIYAASFLPFSIERVPRVLTLIVAQMLIVLAEGWYFTATTPHHSALHVGWPNTIIAIFLMIVIGGGNIFFAEQKRADCKLRDAQQENVALAAVAERERIARDLHDVLGHTLSVIVLKAELAKRLLTTDPARAATEIADVERTARTALAEVREAIGGYRSRGLAAEIETARRTLDTAGIALVLNPDAAGVTLATNAGAPGLASETWLGPPLNPHEETALALALREAVTNIVRHARATTCTLRFASEDGARRLIVEDNGATPITREGNGLRGMRERIESLGGHLALEHDRGTRLLITLPTHS
jgi:two-component system sensor histidine kinase DesK